MIKLITHQLGKVTLYLKVECQCYEAGEEWCVEECNVIWGMAIHVRPDIHYDTVEQQNWAWDQEFEHVEDMSQWHSEFLEKENEALSDSLGGGYTTEKRCLDITTGHVYRTILNSMRKAKNASMYNHDTGPDADHGWGGPGTK